MNRLLFFLILSLSFVAHGKYILPGALDSSSQEVVARDMGFGSATKMNTDSSPLGGYEGLQLMLSRDFVNVSKIKTVGTGGTQDSYFTNTTLMIGKGLFYDVDAFFQITPPQGDDFSAYGMMLRGRFANYENLNLHLGGLVHGSLSQIANNFGSNVFGFDLYGYFEIKAMTLTLGAGQAKGICTYVGSGLTTPATVLNSKVDLTSKHLWGGLSYHLGPWVLAASVEEYFDWIYSTKLAYNF